MTSRTRTGLACSAALALVLVGAAGCGDDDSSSASTTTAATITDASTTVADDDDATSSSSSATSSTTDPDGSASSTSTSEAVPDRTAAPDATTPATSDPDGTTSSTSTTEAVPDQTTEPDATTGTSDPASTTAPSPGGGLADRLPEIDGFERSVAPEDEAGFDGELCDGSTATTTPTDQAGVEYDESGDDGTQFDIIGLAFASEADAGTFFEEITSTTAGCEKDDLTIDEGSPSDIGDEGIVYRVTGSGDDGAMTGLLHVSLSGDEVWILGQERVDSATPVVDPVLDAFRSAVET